MLFRREEIPNNLLEEIRRIIKTDAFRKVNSIVHICDLEQDEEKIIENVQDYVWMFLSEINGDNYIKGFYHLISFIDSYDYSTNIIPDFTLPSENGEVMANSNDLLVICNGYHIYHDLRYLKGANVIGLYVSELYLGKNHRIYISKKSMLSRDFQASENIREEVDYNSIMAENVFEYFGLPCAKYYLMKDKSGAFNSILTESFLKKNQELIHLSEFFKPEKFDDTHMTRLSIIIDNLSLRYKNKMDSDVFEKMIEKVQLDFCKQSLFKLLIGPMDSNFGNTAVILTHHNHSGIPDVDIAPAYDLDLSFLVAEDMVNRNEMGLIMDNNHNPSTIESIIEEFKDIPGFKEFLQEVIKKLSSGKVIDEIVNSVCQKTNLKYFTWHKRSYRDFLNKRFKKLLKAYEKCFLVEEEENESFLGR